MLDSAAPGAPLTVCVKRTDKVGAQYAALRGVATQLTVAELITRWLAQSKLDVSPSLVSLRLLPYTGDPTPAQEAAATELEPDDRREWWTAAGWWQNLPPKRQQVSCQDE